MEPVKTPQQRQREEEANYEQELEHIKGHTHSRCLKWEAWRSSLRSKDKESHQCCQAIGREVRIVHHHETLYPPAVFTQGDELAEIAQIIANSAR